MPTTLIGTGSKSNRTRHRSASYSLTSSDPLNDHNSDEPNYPTKLSTNQPTSQTAIRFEQQCRSLNGCNGSQLLQSTLPVGGSNAFSLFPMEGTKADESTHSTFPLPTVLFCPRTLRFRPLVCHRVRRSGLSLGTNVKKQYQTSSDLDKTALQSDISVGT